MTELADAIVALCDRFDELAGDHVGAATEQIRRGLADPLRLAVVGRVKAGKSTLVNALVGRRVAATDDAECTRVVTHYMYDPPQRAELHLVDGSTMPVPLVSGVLPETLGPPLEQISHVVIKLTDKSLQHYTLIDTPGLSTTTAENEARARRAILGDGGPRQADAMIYVFRDAEYRSDVEFLHEFHQAAGGASSSAAIGVLSHADTYVNVWGSRDPIDAARDRATEMAAQRVGELAGVIAVAGRMAETATTGRLRESDAEALTALAGVRAVDLAKGEIPDGVDDAVFDRLSENVGYYGLKHGRDNAASASDLSHWLLDRSGVLTLRSALNRQYVGRYPQLKAMHAFRRLDQLAHTSPERRMDLIRVLSEAKGTEVLHALVEVTAWERLVSEQPDHPLNVTLDRLLTARDDRGRLGLPVTADSEQIAAEAIRLVPEVRRYKAGSSESADAAADAVITSLTLIAVRNG